MAGVPLIRIRLNQPAIREAVDAIVIATSTPLFVIAMESGFTHYSKFSALINADEIVATPANIQKIERIAKRINFPKSRLFLDAGR